MRIFQMSLLMFSAGLFDHILSGSSSVIPSKEEQANLLTNVQEVFEQVKLLVNIEANSTDESVVCDINRMVQRAKDKLILLEELTLTKMSCTSNAVCMLEFKDTVAQLTTHYGDALKLCVKSGSEAIFSNSRQLNNATAVATQRGQDFLDALYNCSRKNGLHVISCYKDVIAKDVAPVKIMLLGAIEAHKDAHLRTIDMRRVAGDCVDDLLNRYSVKMAAILDKALHCS